MEQLPPDLEQPAVRSQQSGRVLHQRLALSQGPEPQLPQPAHSGLLPGDRADQLPVVLLPPGAGSGFGVILQGINTDIATTNTNNFYGADLDFGRTITFEFGVRHAFSDDMVLDVAAYNRDNLSNAAGRLVSRFDPLRGNNQNIRIMTNADFGNTRGIDLRLDRRFGNLFNGTLSYTFQQAKNTGSDPDTYLDFGSRVLNQVSGGNQPPPQAILPTDFSRPHNLALAAALNFPNDWQQGTIVGSVLENVGLFATFRYTSG